MPRGALTALALLAGAEAALPPGLAASWTASARCPGFPLVSHWKMDLRGEKPRYRELDAMPAISNESLMYAWDLLQADASKDLPPDVTYGTEGGDAACAPGAWPVINISNPFAAAFRTGRNWTTEGNFTVEGRSCALWSSPALPGSFFCVDETGAPRMYVQGYKFKCFLENVTVGPVPDSAFEPTEACKTYPAPACASGNVVNFTVYRLHAGNEPIELDNRDSSDALGSPTIICNWYSTDQSYVTAFEVTANSSWGQYGRCHFNGSNYCDAGTGNHVGRQSPQGVPPSLPQQGQCSENTEIGSWFSFPAAGKCAEGAVVGTGGCTWTARALRTVHASCIDSHRFRHFCKTEVGHGYHQGKSAAIIERALASSNPLKGGCPTAHPHERETEIII